ncbi:MAG: DUF6531 domain-containing protein [Acidobacteriota bacterium]
MIRHPLLGILAIALSPSFTPQLRLAAQPANPSAPIVLKFDELSCYEDASEFYNGGYALDKVYVPNINGSGPGPARGVSFAGSLVVNSAASAQDRCNSTFTNFPSDPNALQVDTARIAVDGGFTDSISFYYFSDGGVSISIFEQNDDPKNPKINQDPIAVATVQNSFGCTPGNPLPYCNWRKFTLSFKGTAKFIRFFSGCSCTHLIIDNLTLGSAGLDSTDGSPTITQTRDKSNGSPTSSCKTCDPINIASGNLTDEVVDYQTFGNDPLEFTRYFNSLSSANTFASTLGEKWRSTYDRYIRIASATSVMVERPDGQILAFGLSGQNWISDTDVDLKLTNVGSTWTLTTSEDTVETYTAISATEATLTRIHTRTSYAQDLQYAAGLLSAVTDSFGRRLLLTYQDNLLRTLTTPDGLVLTYSFDSSGTTAGVKDRILSVSYSTSPSSSITYIYESSAFPFSPTGLLDELGNRFTTWTYDSTGRAASSQHAGSTDKNTLVYNANGTTTLTYPLGFSEVYTFTTLQSLAKVTQIARSTPAATHKFTYDSNGYKASETDWNGNLTTYVNDSRGLPTTIIEAAGTSQARSTTIAYHSTLHVPVSIATPGSTTTFSYDSTGNLLTRTETDTTTSSSPYSTQGTARTWTYTWSNGLLASAQGPRGDVSQLTKFTYDSSGTLTSTADALGHKISVTQHMPGGLPQTIVDANGITTNLSYDSRLRLLSGSMITASGPLTTTYTYDAVGNLLSSKLPDGSTLKNSYDQAHRLTGTVDALNQSLALTLDAQGNRTLMNVLDSNSKIQRTRSAAFDGLGERISDIGGVGQKTAYIYDPNGNAVTITDPLGRVMKQSFDALNRRAKITDPAGGITTITYDSHDHPLTVTDPNGGTTSYVYDGFGNLIQQTSPDTGTTVYRYDLAGNLIQKVDATGAVANYTYDALDRVTTIKYPGDPALNVTFTYDESGYGFGIGRLTTVTDAVGVLHRTYDERGNVLNETRSR